MSAEPPGGGGGGKDGGRVVPTATYRVQLHEGFTFDDAAALAGYLAELGISHLYCSPYLQAAPGSTHGYDVVDHGAPSSELGGAEAHSRMIQALARHGLGHVLDVVPNHMATTGRANAWWWEVLRDGRSGRYASYFDIDWSPPEERLLHTVLVPILGDHYGRVLEAGELELVEEEDEVVLRYHENILPISPSSIEDVFGLDVDARTIVERANADVELLHELLQRQHYRLAYWRVAGQELNYRRFFAINELAALRMENPRVFRDVHEFVLSLVAEGKLQGLRIDHIDGLREPESYLERLRARAPDAYIVVEKILEPGERLPETWPVEGTTGYDFLNIVQGLFVDPSGEKPLTELYRSFAGGSTELDEQARTKKLMLMRTELAADLKRLTDLLMMVCERHRRYRDYTRIELETALDETIAALSVYRTYVDARSRRVTDQDRRFVAEAIETATDRCPDLDPELFSFISKLLVLDVEGELEDDFAMRFQQVSGPVMAKGSEDTLFYTYNRFAALNEVGGDPGRFGIGVAQFHAFMSETQRLWPHTMLATSTHDTKRSEDVRARLCLLSEIPERWAEAVGSWSSMNERYNVGGWPDGNAEYLLYQTLVGAWDARAFEEGSMVERIVRYMHKSSKEAKDHTSWIDPDEHYDAALRSFVESVMRDGELMEEVGSFASGLVEGGRVNSLAQTLIKLTAPGVPDIYQGQELWDLSLVDPDNRRPVDYTLRRRLLAEVGSGFWSDATAHADAGGPKVFVTQRALRVRRDDPGAFRGSYAPVTATGAKADHCVAFCRGGRIVTVAPRLVVGLRGDWGDTVVTLPPGTWRNVLTEDALAGGEVSLSRLLAACPVALLVTVE